MDSLTRSAITRAQAALDMASRSAPAPERFPIADLVRQALGDSGDMPERCYAENAKWTARGHAPAHGGFRVSLDEFMCRDLTTATTTGTSKAGNLIGSSRPVLVNELGVSPVVTMAGAQLMQLDTAGSLPYLSAGATAYWVSENTAPTQSATTVGLRSLTPCTVAAYVDISHRLRLQTALQLDNILRLHLGRAIARALDTAALGAGTTNSPVGIVGMAGVGSVSLGSSGALTRAQLAALVKDATDANGIDAASRAAFIVPSSVALKAYRSVTADTGQFLYKPETAITGRLGDWPCFVSDCAPAGTVIFGDWSQLYLVNHGPLEILVDRFSGSKTGSVRLTAFLDVAVQAGQVEAFSVATGANVS
ncbi:MAG: phage major capsid protein [Gammaproteobacteria bacterium]|nr:phage major capsid protein [Gammaproteobacteria bacterium]